MTMLVTGGAASGKSEIAESLAVNSGGKRLVYAATMQVFDAESEARVERHRVLRRGKGFETLECPFGLPESEILLQYDGLLLECLSNLTANVLFGLGKHPDEAVECILGDISRLFQTVNHVVIVTNEVFSDGGHYDDSTQSYIRTLGEINRRIASNADVVVESVCGIPLIVKGKDKLPNGCFC